jgi:hypothetical protein
MDAATWERPDPGEIRVLGSGSDWDNFGKEYERLLADDLPGQAMGPHMGPFNRCLEVARANGATSVVVETRYLDLDYRSEFSSYYSRGFRTPPHSARRLHFFRAPLRDEQLWDLPEDAGYLGYVVVRPVSLGPVGRTMLCPPPAMQAAVRTAVTETVTLFGQPLPITAVPFMQQDAQLDRCAHAAAWSCHYSAYRRHEVSRRAMAAFSLMADSSLSVGRAVPSEGLTVLQLLELLRLFDLPCQYYDIENLPSIAPGPGTPPDPTPALDGQGNRLPAGRWDTRIISICCRYLNSGVPVLVGNQGTDAHAWTLCGYERQGRPGGSDWIRFVRHDDQRGPYLWVDDVLNDQIPGDYEYSPWRYLLVPLPEKLWLTPGPAEGSAALLLPSLAQALVSAIPGAPAQELLDRVAAGEFRLRTYSRPANDFKNGLLGRVDPVVQREYRMARFPRYIWVVEAIDRARRGAGVADCVIGEAIFDGTSSGLRPQVLALHVPGAMVIYPTDEPFRGPIMCSPDAYRTGGIGPV